MKRRVLLHKQNKRHLRMLQAALRVEPPLSICVDASLVRAAVKARLTSIQSSMQESFGVPCHVWYCPSTRRNIESSCPEGLPLLLALHEFHSSITHRDQNETKAITSVVKHAIVNDGHSVIFLASLSHDLRREAAQCPRILMVNFALADGCARIDGDSVHRVLHDEKNTSLPVSSSQSLGGVSTSHVPPKLPPSDIAFIKKLKAEKLVNSLPIAVETLVERENSSPNPTSSAASITHSRRKSRKANRSNPNPLSCKKKAKHAPYRSKCDSD